MRTRSAFHLGMLGGRVPASLLSEQGEALFMNGSEEVCTLASDVLSWRAGGGGCCLSLPPFGEMSVSSSFRYVSISAFRRKYPIRSPKAAKGASRERLCFQVITWDHHWLLVKGHKMTVPLSAFFSAYSLI